MSLARMKELMQHERVTLRHGTADEHIDAVNELRMHQMHAPRFALHNDPLIITVTLDGNQVSALIGEYLQSGVAGFGNTLSDALRDLASGIEKYVLPSEH